MKTYPKSLLIATFAPWHDNNRKSTNGMIEPLLYYFSPRVNQVHIIEQPYPGSDRVSTFFTQHVNGKAKNKIKKALLTTIFLYPFLFIENKPGTRLSFKVRDFFSTIELGITSGRRYEIFIGLESVNTLAGIMLKKMGIAKKVVYYVSDYSPKRYKNKYLNYLYLWLDRYCAYNSDYIWDVSIAMQPARIKAGLIQQKSAPVIYVPNALFKEQISYSQNISKEDYTAVFVGTLGLENGPDLAIRAIARVAKKLPKITLHIIGGGEEEEYLRNLTKRLKVEKNVVFHGFISDVKKISNIIKHFQVALAPYKYQENSVRLYGDATKIRQYLAAGLPVITTPVPPIGRECQEKGACLIVDDNAVDISNALSKVFEKDNLKNSMAKNAFLFAKKNTWENTYGNALLKMGYKI